MKHKCEQHGHHHPEEVESLGNLTQKLRGKARKITGPRQAILEVLRQQPHPLTNKEILAALPGKECDLATIYRSMHMLESMGMVQRFDFGDGVARYELVNSGEEGHHHHHLICTQCSQIVELDHCILEDLETKIASSSGFKGISHKLEFFGICPQCQ